MHPHPIEEPFDPETVDGVPVIVADEVARFCREAFSEPHDISEAVATMAPPFDSFWVEFQNAPNFLDAHAWGVHIKTLLERPDPYPGDSEAPRWVLSLSLFLERRKGLPYGPVAHFAIGLGEDGTWFRHDDGDAYWASNMPEFEPAIPEALQQEWKERLVPMLFPVLMTISFMHASNVSIEEVEPSEKLSKKYQKRTGRPLTRYHVLNIDPMRRELEANGAARGQLRKSLHIARGHFKVFTEDAPLFGRHTGTYWWAPQVRGRSEEGIVVKGYRVNAPGILGRAYVEASEKPGSPPAPSETDADAAGRGRGAHGRTQNLVARTVANLGFVPRTPQGDEPRYDLAWVIEGTTWVCEVKSLTDTNEERQLQRAIGQVIRYRQKLAAEGRDVQAVIVTEKQPNDSSWELLCGLEAIVLAWPGVLEDRLLSADEEGFDDPTSLHPGLDP